jgi:hypothetical protein
MFAVRTTVQNGRIEVSAPDAIQDGTEVLVELTPISSAKIGLEESEWCDDSAAMADWDAWIQTIEPLDFTPDERADFARFKEEVKRYSIEAVRRQMEQNLFP